MDGAVWFAVCMHHELTYELLRYTDSDGYGHEKACEKKNNLACLISMFVHEPHRLCVDLFESLLCGLRSCPPLIEIVLTPSKISAETPLLCIINRTSNTYPLFLSWPPRKREKLAAGGHNSIDTLPPASAAAAAAALFSLTNPTNSSNTPGHAPSSLHHPILSSSKLFCTNTPVCSHRSLLTPFFQRVSRYSANQSSQGVVGVFQAREGAVSRRRQ